MARDADGDEFVGFTEETPAEAPQAPTDKQDDAGNAPESGDDDESASASSRDENADGQNGSDSDDDGGDEDEGGEKAEKSRNKPAKQRIGELTKKLREAERRLAALENPQPQQPEAVATPDLKEPDPSEYEFGEADPGYLKALAKYEVKVELAAERAENEQKARERAFTERAQALDTQWSEQASKATEKYEDFAEVVADYQESEPCPIVLAAAIQQSEVGTDVVYHLAKHPKENRELARLAETDPLEAARRFGRLEARFMQDEAPKPKARTVTNAPTPPQHTTRGAGGKYTPDYSSDNVDLDLVYKAVKP